MNEKEELKLMLGQQTIKNKVAELSAQIISDYQDQKFLLLCVLKGSFIFCADLYQEICKTMPDVDIEFIRAKSYQNSMESSGVVQLEYCSLDCAKDKHILIVEDIIDRGLTIKTLKDLYITEDAKSVKVCVLLDKVEKRIVDIKPDYVGFQIPDEFVVGYGLDYAEKYRGLTEIHTLTLSNKK